MHTDIENLHVLIVEISMSAQLLYCLHHCLQDLKGYTGDNTKLGNVTIIAVGDLFQSPPCFAGKIFGCPSNWHNPTDLHLLHEQLWKENFQLHELTRVEAAR